LINYSSTIKQCFYGTGILCILISIAVFFVNPDDPGVTLNTGEYTQNEASLILLVFGGLLFPLYHLLYKFLKFDYVPDSTKSNNDNEWFK